MVVVGGWVSKPILVISLKPKPRLIKTTTTTTILKGFDTIEINLVSFKNEHPAISLQYLGQEFTKE